MKQQNFIKVGSFILPDSFKTLKKDTATFLQTQFSRVVAGEELAQYEINKECNRFLFVCKGSVYAAAVIRAEHDPLSGQRSLLVLSTGFGFKKAEDEITVHYSTSNTVTCFLLQKNEIKTMPARISIFPGTLRLMEEDAASSSQLDYGNRKIVYRIPDAIAALTHKKGHLFFMSLLS